MHWYDWIVGIVGTAVVLGCAVLFYWQISNAWDRLEDLKKRRGR